MKPIILINKIEYLKSIYKATAIYKVICQELEISFKTYYRYMLDITLMPVDKAIRLYMILGLSLTDLQSDLQVSSEGSIEDLIKLEVTKVA